jgi:hypothetical protein
MRKSIGVVALLAVGCGSAEEPDKAPKVFEAGITDTPTELAVATEDFTLAAGDERFLCYTKTLERDAVISEYQYEARPGMHHFVLARTSGNEPDGFSECDVLFRQTWSPLFIGTTADAELKIPTGAANVLPAGTRLLIQLHLLNSTNREIKQQAVVQMKRSTEQAPVDAGLYVFGKTDLELPPQQTSSVTASCTTGRNVTFFAMLPHMHYLGRGLKIEAGPDDNSLSTIFEDNAYDFDNQELKKFDFTIPQGHRTRTTCTFDNPGTETITFGESSTNEMCFAIGFALNVKGASGCISGSTREYPRDPAAGECASVVPNELGVGKPCTAGGNQCSAPLQCSADVQPTPDGVGMCISLGCTSKAECGGGSASCCSFGLANVCIPEACRPLTCAPQP